MPTYRLDRKSRAKLAAIWKPEYDALAWFNRDKARGVAIEPEYAEWMAEVQRDYDEIYLPASRHISAEGRLRRCWFG